MFTLKKLRDRIYLLSFEDKYELAMHFLRAQEFHECPNPEFKGKHFKLMDYISWYSKEHNGVFSYAKDWDGFNVTGKVLRKLYNFNDTTTPRGDWNERDFFIREICKFIHAQTSFNSWDFSLLGAMEDDVDTIDHELAHALYAMDPAYKGRQHEARLALAEKETELHDRLCQALTDIGYAPEVIVDELQAYLSVEQASILADDFTQEEWERMAPPFVSIFSEYK